MKASEKKKKVAVFLIHSAPYYEPVFKKLVARDDFEWDFSHVFSCDYGHSGMFSNEVQNVIAADIKTLNPNFFSAMKVAWRLMCKFSFSRKYDMVMWPSYAPWWFTIPILVRLMLARSYSVSLDTIRDTGGRVSKFIKSIVFRNAEFLWVPGLASKRYLVNGYKIDEKKIATGLYIPQFSRCSETVKNDEPVFLMVANNRSFRKMEVVKEGFEKYRRNGGVGRLILCGKDTSCFAGEHIETIEGVLSTELPKLYARADVYVHNGNEQFSTALLMGAMARKPLISSVDVGVWEDLFKGEDLPGISVERWNTSDAWSDAFTQMIQMRAKWDEMGRCAEKLASCFVPDRVVEEIVKKIYKCKN